MKYDELLNRLQNLINKKISQSELCKITGTSQSTMSNRQARNSDFSADDIQKLNLYFGINLYENKITKVMPENKNCIPITYLPEIYLSAGFGVENYFENQEKMMIDAALLVSEKGNKINPQFCKIVRISGNSMSPEYRHGDRVIIDENDKELSDGQIFAFRYEGKCYVKEINLMGKNIKCISLNKDYDPFYIKEDEEITVLGRILPRIRL